jgi:hypothetical protein
MRQRLNRSTVGMRHHSAYGTLVQHVHWPDPSGPDDGVQERTSLHAAGSRKRPRGAALAAALVARELSLACHREHGTQTFAVDDIGLAHLALLAAFPGNQPGGAPATECSIESFSFSADDSNI